MDRFLAQAVVDAFDVDAFDCHVEVDGDGDVDPTVAVRRRPRLMFARALMDLRDIEVEQPGAARMAGVASLRSRTCKVKGGVNVYVAVKVKGGVNVTRAPPDSR